MSGNMTSTFSQNSTTIRAYTSPGFTPLESYSFPESILHYLGVPITTPSQYSPLHLLVFTQGIKVAFRSIIYTGFNLQSITGSGQCSAAVLLLQSSTYRVDYIILSFTYLLAVAPVGLVSVNIGLTLQFDAISSSYSLTVSSSYQMVASFSANVAKMTIANGLVLLQLQDGSLMIYSSSTGQISPAPFWDASIGTNPNSSLMYANNAFYVLYSSGLIKLNIVSIQYQGSVLISSLPNNTYRAMLGPLVDILYVSGTPFLYKGDCDGQFYKDAMGGCSPYVCDANNCLECVFVGSTCSLCTAGYIRSDSLVCVIQIDNLSW
jgi:hypothetical protein